MAKALWTTVDRRRWFLLPPAVPLDRGEVTVTGLDGSTARVDARWLALFEVDEAEARDWAGKALGETLEALRRGIDDTLAAARTRLAEARHRAVQNDSAITADAVPALFALLKTLPGVIGNSLSGREGRVGKAKDSAADLERRLREAGIDLGERLSGFPDRLAALRSDLEKVKAGDRRS
jgi:hypothetical protein